MTPPAATFSTLRDFVRRDFQPAYHGAVALFLAAALWLNYAVDFKRTVLNPALAEPSGVLWFAAFYAVPWFVAGAVGAWLRPDDGALRSPLFWAVGAFVAFALALDSWSARLPGTLVEALGTPAPLREWARLSLVNLDRTVAIALPVLLFAWLARCRRAASYGLTWRGCDRATYAALFALMLPCVIWASSRPDFLATYPTYRPGAAEAYLGAPDALGFGLYAGTKAARFVTIELFFRGFLVLALSRWLGAAALLPMVALYTFWHFGKPPAEAAGAAVAAYVLGALALCTRSITGGILLHVGVALAMECAAYARWH